ncbi:MAG: hypothetical protein ACJ71K_00570 [Nitrososphaeraceae archaeon]
MENLSLKTAGIIKVTFFNGISHIGVGANNDVLSESLINRHQSYGDL